MQSDSVLKLTIFVLEGEFAEMDGWNAEVDAEILLNGLGITSEHSFQHIIVFYYNLYLQYVYILDLRNICHVKQQ